MFKHLIHSRRAVVAAGGASLALAAAGVAVAAIPDASGTLTGCYAKTGGQLRLIDAQAGATCTSKETAITWNQSGPAGPAGPAGQNGATNVTTRLKTISIPAGGTADGIVYCETGERATGGSGALQAFTPGLSNGAPAGWETVATNLDSVSRSLKLSVICAAP